MSYSLVTTTKLLPFFANFSVTAPVLPFRLLIVPVASGHVLRS